MLSHRPFVLSATSSLEVTNKPMQSSRLVEFKLLGINKMLPLGMDKPNRARRTPQIPGSQPEQALGVLNSICNLEALSEPQAAWVSREARVRISNLRLANGQRMVGNRQSRPTSMGGAVIHATTSHHERKRGWMVRLPHTRGARERLGQVGTARAK